VGDLVNGLLNFMGRQLKTVMKQVIALVEKIISIEFCICGEGIWGGGGVLLPYYSIWMVYCNQL
jgi:hypothetical protein